MTNEPSGADAAPRYALRPVEDRDEPLLLRLYAETRAAEMALVPWTDEQKAAFVRMQFDAQRADYSRRHADGAHSIVLDAGGEPVGRLWVTRRDEAIHVVDLVVLEARRGAGIGGAVLRDLMREADEADLPLRVYVETVTPAPGYFERLGFVAVEDTGFHRRMEYRRGADGAAPRD